MKKIITFNPNDLVTVPKSLGYIGSPSKERITYIFKGYRDNDTRCTLINTTTGQESTWDLGWVKPLKK